MEPRTTASEASESKRPPDSLHCFVFRCIDIVNDWWSAYSRSLRSLSCAAPFDRCLRLTKLEGQLGANRLGTFSTPHLARHIARDKQPAGQGKRGDSPYFP